MIIVRLAYDRVRNAEQKDHLGSAKSIVEYGGYSLAFRLDGICLYFRERGYRDN